MIYIRDNTDALEKYEITFDQAKLKELKNMVIKKCCEIRKVNTECKRYEIPNNNAFYSKRDDCEKFTTFYYEDVKYRKSGNTATEWDHYDKYEVDLYYCEYIQYRCQYFVDFIDNIIAGNEKCLTILFNKDLSQIDRFLTVKERINLSKKQLSINARDFKLKKKKKLAELSDKYKAFNEKTDNIAENYSDLQSMLQCEAIEISKIEEYYDAKAKIINKELEDLLKLEELNKNQEPIDPYFEELVSLVDFRLVDTIGKNEINRINEFFDEEIIPFEMKKVKTLIRKK